MIAFVGEWLDTFNRVMTGIICMAAGAVAGIGWIIVREWRYDRRKDKAYWDRF